MLKNAEAVARTADLTPLSAVSARSISGVEDQKRDQVGIKVSGSVSGPGLISSDP